MSNLTSLVWHRGLELLFLGKTKISRTTHFCTFLRQSLKVYTSVIGSLPCSCIGMYLLMLSGIAARCVWQCSVLCRQTQCAVLGHATCCVLANSWRHSGILCAQDPLHTLSRAALFLGWPSLKNHCHRLSFVCSSSIYKGGRTNKQNNLLANIHLPFLCLTQK